MTGHPPDECSMIKVGIIDTHAHIIDPLHFPYADGPGYKPDLAEAGTADEFVSVLDSHGVAHCLLVQPSGYGYDNRAILDAMRRHPRRFKAIAVLDPETPERELERLAELGVVGVRFNLQSYRADALVGAVAERYLARLKSLGWFAQVFADDAQWVEAAPLLDESGVKVLVDHFGMRNPKQGVKQPGFKAVLGLGRGGNASVKLSAPFRLAARADGFADLDPVAAALIDAFRIDRCVWGSDWPFINFPAGFSYDAALAALDRWVPDAERRQQVLWDNPRRLFAFGGSST